MINKMLDDMFWDYSLWGEDVKFVYKIVLSVFAIVLIALFISIGIFIGQKTAAVSDAQPIASEATVTSGNDVNINVNVN